MNSRFFKLFKTYKPIIAMVHLGALIGKPLLNLNSGQDAILENARNDFHALQDSDVNPTMFRNENDRPYEFEVDVASTATVAYITGRLRNDIEVPFGG